MGVENSSARVSTHPNVVTFADLPATASRRLGRSTRGVAGSPFKLREFASARGLPPALEAWQHLVREATLSDRCEHRPAQGANYEESCAGVANT